jgi:hypothetical protein
VEEDKISDAQVGWDRVAKLIKPGTKTEENRSIKYRDYTKRSRAEDKQAARRLRKL